MDSKIHIGDVPSRFDRHSVVNSIRVVLFLIYDESSSMLEFIVRPSMRKYLRPKYSRPPLIKSKHDVEKLKATRNDFISRNYFTLDDNSREQRIDMHDSAN